MKTVGKVQGSYAKTMKSGGLARTTLKLGKLGMKSVKTR
jgi:hypothetical protein